MANTPKIGETITTIANTPIALSPLINGISAISSISILRYGIRDTMRAINPNMIAMTYLLKVIMVTLINVPLLTLPVTSINLPLRILLARISKLHLLVPASSYRRT